MVLGVEEVDVVGRYEPDAQLLRDFDQLGVDLVLLLDVLLDLDEEALAEDLGIVLSGLSRGLVVALEQR